jgi:hypothetical protein
MEIRMNTQPIHLSPEMLVARLGDSLIHKGHISEDDLSKALAHQQEQLAQGKTCPLGQALIELNLLKQSALDQVVTDHPVAQCAAGRQPQSGGTRPATDGGVTGRAGAAV